MNERINIIFHEACAGDPYCLLALCGDAGEPSLPRLLNLLIQTIEDATVTAEMSMSALTAKFLKASRSYAGSNLLPADASWAADLTVNILLRGDEFRLTCKKMDLSRLSFPDLGPDAIDAIDGFDGNVQQLKGVLGQIEWS